MTSDFPELDARLQALREATLDARPPASTDDAIARAIRRKSRGRFPRVADRWLALPLALAASIAMIAFVVRSLPPSAPERSRPDGAAMVSAREAFIPLVPSAEIGRTSDAMLIPTRVPRTSLAELGWPIDPARAADDVDAELLVRPDGAVLAVRFVN